MTLENYVHLFRVFRRGRIIRLYDCPVLQTTRPQLSDRVKYAHKKTCGSHTHSEFDFFFVTEDQYNGDIESYSSCYIIFWICHLQLLSQTMPKLFLALTRKKPGRASLQTEYRWKKIGCKATLMRNQDAISYPARLCRIYLIKNYGPALEYMVYLVASGCRMFRCAYMVRGIQYIW